MNLNEAQKRAIAHVKGPCLVIAGPGSGKTAVLTKRVYELINSGIPAEEVLVITFTKAAAIEMKERFDRLSGEIKPVTFGTFHSLFWGILQKELGYKSSDIIMGTMQTKLLKQAMQNAKIDTSDTVLVNAYKAELTAINNSLTNINSYKPKFVDQAALKRFIDEYEGLKDKYHVIDFDDMLKKAYRLFVEKPGILEKWQRRFSYFLVDEMQDMNDLQFNLIRMLSSRTNNLFCVGDDDQSIYGFRGANPKIMSDFMECFKEAEKIVLDYNYRNPSNIVEKAAELIAKNENRFSKEIKTTATSGMIKTLEFKSPLEEAEAVVRGINCLKKEGVEYHNIAILYRNHSDARYVVDLLASQKIPFYLKEQMPNIYSHFIISDIESYFQIAIGNVTKARMLNVINKPNRFIHRQCIENGITKNKMLSFYNNNPSCYRNVESFWADIVLISKMSPVAAINYIRRVMQYDSYLYAEACKNGSDINDYYEILEFVTDIFKDCRTIKQSLDKLNMLKLKIDYENKNKSQDKSGRVGLYTLHSSKGLEFDSVFIISANDGVIPTNKAESKEDIEAERRLFYVGITRTKRKLFITYNNKKNRDKSRFLDEMKL